MSILRNALFACRLLQYRRRQYLYFFPSGFQGGKLSRICLLLNTFISMALSCFICHTYLYNLSSRKSNNPGEKAAQVYGCTDVTGCMVLKFLVSWSIYMNQGIYFVGGVRELGLLTIFKIVADPKGSGWVRFPYTSARFQF